jgi:uncharacterized phage-associated protein
MLQNSYFRNNQESFMPIKFNINTQKAVESLLWVIKKGESNIYNIMKILFAAEKYHLNTYGRPITGDKYIAMEYGTVPSWIFDATKLERPCLGFIKVENTLTADREPDLNYFSESDIEALEKGFNEYAGKSFSEVLKKNHDEIAWKNAYEKRGSNNSADIDFEDMIEEDWLIKDLTYLAPHMAL